jgi:hypothetical protein
MNCEHMFRLKLAITKSVPYKYIPKYIENKHASV